MKNRLQYESSPYLRQHAGNPVNWYPWGSEAFARAREEDKPIFLSIGYSTCHWCHVMAHESFESDDVARILNDGFISIKVDKEERPDIDSVYMRVCQAFTSSGGWPLSVFITADQKPFFAGTYFPKRSSRGMIGFMELASTIRRQWDEDREALLDHAEEIITHLNRTAAFEKPDKDLITTAVRQYQLAFDQVNGGFGDAPKFPAPHNLLFLLENYRRTHEAACANMVSKTLMRMYRGGLFDHIGGGFSRYSTDAKWLIPHFEKMLYDNALLIMAYSRAHAILGDQAEAELFLKIAERTAEYVLNEMTSPDGGFYSAQDADSEGEEGKYYVFKPEEIRRVLPEQEASAFCQHFGITPKGNFEGKSILNLLSGNPFEEPFKKFLEPLYQYRKQRHSLHLDDKILTAWNGLMISALCEVYLESGKYRWLDAAKRADRFISEHLISGEKLYASLASGHLGENAFLDDYAAYCYAQLSLYRATLETAYLDKAEELCEIVLSNFSDNPTGGFFFSGKNGERLLLRPKETYDGAMPSGNSLMAWNLVRLWQLTGKETYQAYALNQLDFLTKEASAYPMGYSMFLSALQEFHSPSMKVIIVSPSANAAQTLIRSFPAAAILRLQKPNNQYPALDEKTTFYICEGTTCRPPVNDIQKITGIAPR